jgi:hypothetical protein
MSSLFDSESMVDPGTAAATLLIESAVVEEDE